MLASVVLLMFIDNTYEEINNFFLTRTYFFSRLVNCVPGLCFFLKKDSLCLAFFYLYLKNRISLSRENRKEVKTEYMKNVLTALLKE